MNRLKPPVPPLIQSLAGYTRESFGGDLVAGVIVAVMLIPQAMAYAMLAGLPPEIGLYASILPLVLYSLFGSSNTLSVGPVAMVSLLVVSGVGELAPPGSPKFISLCLTLALMVGGLQIVMSLFRMGFLVNFISHPVLVGFTSAAALVIAFSQLKHLFGVSVERGEYPFQLMLQTIQQIPNSSAMTLGIGLLSIVLLVAVRWGAAKGLSLLGLSDRLAETLSRTGPLFAVVVASAGVWLGALHVNHQVSIVGEIPAGLPGLTWPSMDWDTIQSLWPLALVITLVGYLESISVAKALASRRREKVSANQELFALGLADLGAAFSGGYPVTGGFSRSMVNYSAGAKSPMASVITAILVAVSVWALTPLFFYIPKAALAAIIVVAVVGLIDLKTPFVLWRYSRSDAIATAVTFVAVLGLGIETGILIGVGATLVTMMWKTSRPHIAEIGRLGESEHFRNVKRHSTQPINETLVFRIDESLHFANAPFLETYVNEQISHRPEIQNVLLVGSGINDIDATGIEVLESLVRELSAAGIEFWLADIKGPVLDRLKQSPLDNDFLNRRVFLSTHQAIEHISSITSHSVTEIKRENLSSSPTVNQKQEPKHVN